MGSERGGIRLTAPVTWSYDDPDSQNPDFECSDEVHSHPDFNRLFVMNNTHFQFFVIIQIWAFSTLGSCVLGIRKKT